MTFATLALICAVAILGPWLALQRALHVPVVIGELIVGFVLGATGLRVLHASDTTFHFLAEAGFALVMCVAGSHVPIRNPALRSGLVAGLARAAFIGVLAVPVAWLIASVFKTGHTGLYAVLLASSSAGLILPAIEGADGEGGSGKQTGKGEEKRKDAKRHNLDNHGKNGGAQAGDVPAARPLLTQLLPQIAIADAACIVALPLAIDPKHAARAALGGVVVTGVAALLTAALMWLERDGIRRRVHVVSEDHRLAIELRVSLAILFGLSALAVAMHVSVMLAGFSAGLALAAIGSPRRLGKQLFALTEGFFAPIFFVWLGATIDLRNLAGHTQMIGLGIALGVGALLVHAAGTLTGMPWPAATITAAQLGLPVAAATLGTSLNVFKPSEATAILLGALVTMAATAALSGRVRALLAGSTSQPKG